MFHSARRNLVNIFFMLSRKAFVHDKGREILCESLGNRIRSVSLNTRDIKLENLHPYDDLGKNEIVSPIRLSSSPIFITGRFRSGSTLLWNIFRNIDSCTAYYEPLNERQWFDPEIRGQRVDASHVNVGNEYWREYNDLKYELAPYYRERWIHRDLYMDEHSIDWNLLEYIQRLIEHAPGRPILQFNRVDFRLPWLRYFFPNTKFIHIYRHPRDQWVSSLMNNELNHASFNNLHDFQKYDKFYLTSWIHDLQYWFPFLKDWTLHPYRHYYYLWKLSYIFGINFCDISIQYEKLALDHETILKNMFNILDIYDIDWQNITPLIHKPVIGKWKNFASDTWFQEHERACEKDICNFIKCSI